MEKNNSLIGTLIAGLIFLIAGYFVAFYFGKPILNNAKASKSWPTIKGTIKSSRVITHRDKEGTKYSADVVYEYSVNDHTYKSSTIQFGADFNSGNSSKAYEVINQYPEGMEVQVSYNPEKPEVAVLEPGAFFSSYIIWLSGMLFFVVGCLLTGGLLIKVFILLSILFFAGSKVIKKNI